MIRRSIKLDVSLTGDFLRLIIMLESSLTKKLEKELAGMRSRSFESSNSYLEADDKA